MVKYRRRKKTLYSCVHCLIVSLVLHKTYLFIMCISSFILTTYKTTFQPLYIYMNYINFDHFCQTERGDTYISSLFLSPLAPPVTLS